MADDLAVVGEVGATEIFSNGFRPAAVDVHDAGKGDLGISERTPTWYSPIFPTPMTPALTPPITW